MVFLNDNMIINCTKFTFLFTKILNFHTKATNTNLIITITKHFTEKTPPQLLAWN